LRAINECNNPNENSRASKQLLPLGYPVEIHENSDRSREGMQESEKEEGDINAFPKWISHSQDDAAKIDVEWRVVYHDHVDAHEDDEGNSTDTLNDE
jgi:hypothetical protein